MKDLIILYFTLQVICYFMICDVKPPANAEVYIVELIDMIEFKILNPVGIIQLFNPDFVLRDWLNGYRSALVNKDQEASILEELMVFIFITVVAVIGVLVMLILKRSEKYKEKVTRKLHDFKLKFVWNGFIRSIQLAYMKTLVSMGTQLRMWV